METDKNKLSPTPWDLKIIDSCCVIVSAEGDAILIHHNEVNAKIIAAAPKMLEILQSISYGHDPFLYLEDIDDIIKKATN